ncbi:MAG TPA: N4-gp56 family major capsid protein [Prochlorococcaceae cyanobacterium AMR_MDS_5431]|nr:N4-gp56 family major capsid protein [Prochlorococcaceae cyanobacterium AMR_MDS_5431]
MANAYTALSGGTANTNGGLGGGQYSSADNVGTFTPSNGAGLVQKAYDRLVEFALRSQPLLRSVADKRPARQSMPGSSVVFQIYSDLSKATTALSEQVDPDSVAIGAPTAVTVVLNEYGNAVLTTRKLQLMSLADVDPAIANIVAFNMADSIDEIVQTELRGGTNVIYASNASGTRATATTNVTGAHTLKAADIRLAIAKLRAGKAVPRKGSLYWCAIHPEVSHDLRAETGSGSWRLPHEYQTNENIWAGEIGQFEGAYFIESPRMYNATDGASSRRVFRTLLAGQQALAEAVAEEPHVVIGNVTDKLMRLRPIGWYGVLGFKRYREEALYRIESSSSIN